MTRKMKTDASGIEPRLVEGAARQEIDSVHLPLGPFCEHLDGTEVEVRSEEGALIVESLHPVGDALFKALPNDNIEQGVRMALRALTASTAAEPVADAEGRRVHAEGCIVYPPYMEDAPRVGKPSGGAVVRSTNLATVGIAAVIGVLMLVAADIVHPLVLLLVPGVGIGAWALLQARSREMATVTSLPGYEQHLRRGRAQAISISRAASKARGLLT